jgi:uncharacterized protein (DUF1800 family)
MRTIPTIVALAAASLVACSRPASAPVRVSDAVLPVSGPRELTSDEQVAHVLNRLAFGARPGDVEKVKAMGVDRWIAMQLHPERIDDQSMDRVLANYQTVAMSASDLMKKFPRPNVALALARRDSMRAPTAADTQARQQQARRAGQMVGEIQSAKVARAVMSERQLQEVMTDFWENHFTVFAGKGQVRYFLTDYDRQTIRPNALGKFRDLLGAVAKSPAMLFYLDNAQSVADSMHPTLGQLRNGGRGRAIAGVNPRRPFQPRRLPDNLTDEQRKRLEQAAQNRRTRGLNENYARELMELHTLGVDGGYTQKDVIEVARALTGWSITPPRQSNVAFVFRAEAHDAAEKTVLGHTLAAGRGMEDGEDVLNIVARHPSTAKFIARKLCVRFVSDVPPQSLVDRAAATFTATDGDIRAVVQTIVTSPEFFSRAAYRSKIKSPFEVVVSALRAVGAAPDATPRTAQTIARLGQPIFGHQTPNGWPETGDSWMNTGAILNRINFGMALAANRIPGASLDRWPMTATLRGASRDKQVDGVVTALLGGAASAETREVLMSGENPLLKHAASDSTMRALVADSSTVMAMDDDPRAARKPNVGGKRGVLEGRPLGPVPAVTGFAQVVGLALGSPEFQRR